MDDKNWLSGLSDWSCHNALCTILLILKDGEIMYKSLKEAIDDKARFWDYIDSQWVDADEAGKIYEEAHKQGLILKTLEDLIEWRHD